MPVDRNFWDPWTPPGFTEIRSDALVVQLCLYSFARSKKVPSRVQEDVERASRIWCQAGVYVQANHWEKLGTIPRRGSIDLNLPDLAGRLSSTDALNEIKSLGRPICPEGDPSVILPVYYIPGSRFRDGALGGQRWEVRNNREVEHIIVLTDDADGNILAHELGHALFVRLAGQSWTGSDPDPLKNPNDEIHNTDPLNLMFPQVPADPRISSIQGAQARASHLVTAPSLVYGFRDNSPYKLDVVFKTMHVIWTTDELGSDNALESSWRLTVRARGLAATQPYDNDNLAGSTDYTLNLAILDISFPRDPEGPPTDDTLTIQVTGTDRDKNSGNDSLPAINKVWKREEGLWGSGLSRNGLPLGNHREHPPANAEMEYWLDYSISLRQRPRDVIFRDIRCPQSEDASP